MGVGDSARKSLAKICAVLIFCWPIQAKSDGLETFGDIAQIAIPAIALVASVAKGDYLGAAQLGVTTGVTLGITHGLKIAIDRKRPNGGGQSFPSGHTAAAFSGAAYLHFRYGWEYGLPAYAVASVVAISRVKADKHHVTDVVGGAAIAIITAYVFTDSLNEKVTIIPYAQFRKKNFGIIAKIKF